MQWRHPPLPLIEVISAQPVAVPVVITSAASTAGGESLRLLRSRVDDMLQVSLSPVLNTSTIVCPGGARTTAVLMDKSEVQESF